MIDDYNAGVIDADELFEQLSQFAKALEEEEHRAIASNCLRRSWQSLTCY